MGYRVPSFDPTRLEVGRKKNKSNANESAWLAPIASQVGSQPLTYSERQLWWTLPASGNGNLFSPGPSAYDYTHIYIYIESSHHDLSF